MSLLQSQQNELFSLWQNRGLILDDFEISDPNPSIQTARVRHKSERKYYFKFERTEPRLRTTSWGGPGPSYRVEYSPGNHTVVDRFTIQADWGLLIDQYANNWLKNLIRELKEPNLWEEYLKSKIHIATIEEGDNSKYSEPEIAKITSQIDKLRTRIETLEHTQEQLDLANAKLDYLCDRIQHLGKMDWRNVTVTVLVAIYQMFAQNPEMARQIAQFYTELFPFLMHLPKMLGHN